MSPPRARTRSITLRVFVDEIVRSLQRCTKISQVFPTIAWGVIAGLVIGWQWPEFRGPNGSGKAPGLGPAADVERDEHVRWKTALHGRAWSSPVVLGNQVWVTTATPDGHQLSAVALDQATGTVIHDIKLFDVATPQYAHPFNTYASPTPAIDPDAST